MKAAFFLGCTVPVRAQNYELSARRICERFNLEIADLEGLGCCGYPIGGVSGKASLWMAARSLALAERADAELVALCSACAANLSEARLELEDKDHRREAQRALDALGLTYRGTARVRHFARYLYEEVGPERVEAAVERPLEALSLAVHYGCHYTKPSRAHQGPDEPEAPHSLDELVRATGAKTVPHPYGLSCCGGGVLAVRESTALAMAQAKLEAVTECAADALVSICPFCSVMYEGNQRVLEKKVGRSFNLPVLYLSQVIGLSLGLEPKELGMKQNRVKPKALLKQLGL